MKQEKLTTDIVEMKMEENANNTPIICKPYQATNIGRQQIKKLERDINKMKDDQ